MSRTILLFLFLFVFFPDFTGIVEVQERHGPLVLLVREYNWCRRSRLDTGIRRSARMQSAYSYGMICGCIAGGRDFTVKRCGEKEWVSTEKRLDVRWKSSKGQDEFYGGEGPTFAHYQNRILSEMYVGGLRRSGRESGCHAQGTGGTEARYGSKKTPKFIAAALASGSG